MAVPDSRVQRAYRVRISLFLLAVSLALVVWVLGYQVVQTLKVLDVVERERDRWQQAGPVIETLNLKDGSVVADIGSGAGYFTLKLAPMVPLRTPATVETHADHPDQPVQRAPLPG